jgi:hypothetical protein
MTNREALHEAEQKKPAGLWYKVPADDGTGEARLMDVPQRTAWNLPIDAMI